MSRALDWEDLDVLRIAGQQAASYLAESHSQAALSEVKRFDEAAFIQKTRLPHMGWNDVTPCNGHGLFRDLESGARFYFLHSYYFVPREPDHILATTDYNGRYASAVQSGNVLGVQFHPEKSHAWGIQLLKNFAEN